MSRFRSLPLPTTLAPDVRSAFISIMQELDKVVVVSDRLQLKTSNAVPDKPRTGEVFFADGTNWNPGGGEGWYGFDGTNFNKLS